jgi:tetratricopeptide (TPR) repeat protein
MTSKPADLRLSRAVAQHRGGDVAGAEATYRRILRSDPENVDALHLLGMARAAQGDQAQAIAFIRRALRLRPGFAAAWSNLGHVLLSADRSDEAEVAFRQAIAVDPAHAPAHHNLGRLLIDQGRREEALDAAETAARLAPADAESALLRAEILQAVGRPEAAEAALRQGIAHAPRSAALHTNLGNLLAATRPEEALKAHRAAVRIDPGSPIAWYGLASAERALGLVEQASGSIDAALRNDPTMAEAWNLKGAILRARGRFDDAIAAFEEAVRLRPGFAQAIRHIAISRRASADTGEVDRLRALIDGGNLSADEAIATRFALGKVLDELDDPDAAFAAFVEANELVAREFAASGRAYDPARFVAEARAALAPWPMEDQPAPGDLPLLVVGMPRSATTLIEQILASHPAVTAAGELPDLSRACAAGGPIGAAYVEALRSRAAAGAARVVDKMPDNILLLNRLAAAVPAARAIICRRNPCDVALSCFTTRFAAGNAFAYDLWACGHRAAVTTALGAALEASLPLAHLTVDYETLVGDLEGEARRLIAFAGLDWSPRCLEFHVTERPVLTASAWQVRQKLFTGSVGRWQRYAPHLGPLLDGIAAGEADARAALPIG